MGPEVEGLEMNGGDNAIDMGARGEEVHQYPFPLQEDKPIEELGLNTNAIQQKNHQLFEFGFVFHQVVQSFFC